MEEKQEQIDEGKIIRTQQELEEDAGGAAAGASATDAGLSALGNVPGMGQPVLASRGITGSGDVPSPIKKKKKKKVLGYKQFLSDIFNKK